MSLRLKGNHHVIRHVPYGRTLRNDKDEVVGLLESAFRLRPQDNGCLSTNWVEYFDKNSHEENIEATVLAFKRYKSDSGYPVGNNSVFSVGNVANVEDAGKQASNPKIRLVNDGKQKGNESHASIMGINEGNTEFMQLLAEEVFSDIRKSTDYPIP